MNILMMSNTYFPILGGLEKSIRSFAKQFRKMGHKVLIAVPKLGFHESQRGHGVIETPALHGFGQMDLSLALPFPELVSDSLTPFHPKVIHAHHPFLMGEMAVRSAVKYSCPLIYTHHIMLDHYEHYLPLPAASARSFLTELSVGFANLSTRVFAPSESVRKILQKEGVTSPIDIVPTGIDLSLYQQNCRETFRKKWGLPQDAFVAGYAGRFAKEKNLDFLGKTLVVFMKQHPCFFVAAGTGPEEFSFRKIFTQAKLENRVRFEGILQDKEMADFYKALDVFVFASQTETQGLVVAEALAAGTPVIALDGPGIRETVQDNINGYLLSDASIKAFVHAIENFTRLNTSQKRRLQNASVKTTAAFSVKECAKRALAAYHTALLEKKYLCDSSRDSHWRQGWERLKTEWRLLYNLGRAAGHALSGAADHDFQHAAAG